MVPQSSAKILKNLWIWIMTVMMVHQFSMRKLTSNFSRYIIEIPSQFSVHSITNNQLWNFKNWLLLIAGNNLDLRLYKAALEMILIGILQNISSNFKKASHESRSPLCIILGMFKLHCHQIHSLVCPVFPNRNMMQLAQKILWFLFLDAK